jgi:hypothetical protein
MTTTQRDRAFYASLSSDTATDLDWKVSYGLDLYPEAEVAEIERIAAGAQRLAEAEEREGIEQGYSFCAEQSTYGCAWEWREGRDEPTARVFDCDGNTLHEVE